MAGWVPEMSVRLIVADILQTNDVGVSNCLQQFHLVQRVIPVPRVHVVEGDSFECKFTMVEYPPYMVDGSIFASTQFGQHFVVL